MLNFHGFRKKISRYIWIEHNISYNWPYCRLHNKITNISTFNNIERKRISIPPSLGPLLVYKLVIMKDKSCIYLVNLAWRSIKCIVLSDYNVKRNASFPCNTVTLNIYPSILLIRPAHIHTSSKVAKIDR